ncbi:MAG TPA: hypothetical protein VJH20_00670 [Candidatus Nanoarchaeia archaeon]|nr:hypothetical protein [Candidatus Nanoarchaeia archaeon]
MANKTMNDWVKALIAAIIAGILAIVANLMWGSSKEEWVVFFVIVGLITFISNIVVLLLQKLFKS